LEDGPLDRPVGDLGHEGRAGQETHDEILSNFRNSFFPRIATSPWGRFCRFKSLAGYFGLVLPRS
jgi:hypothetical protein